MHILSNLPFAFSHIGQRAINQDTLYPGEHTADEQTELFMVCDGMGGADKGEVASQLLCQGVADYARSMGYPVFDIVHLQAALEQVYETYHDYLSRYPLVNRMGSTLTLLQFHQHGVTVAHLGDSRIYQLRDGKIIFQTKDHKQVNDMVEAGIITATQALTHPWRNRLSRAVVLNSQENLEQAARAVPDVVFLTDVRAGDYFFMCTDGVLEHIDDYVLETILSGNMPDRAKVASLVAMCQDQTRDNYSGYLIGIKSVTESVGVSESAIEPRTRW
ncbi:PP2C family protein-serine/threonine phosphatase [Larkinella rosea]|uniref:Serine/threonine-protein phosphatase n=1 Tax=Larkinella rosea TaxID=2025312 RepID=A0A3P1BU18_9BACT|nr:protein phosphatase 2C domain-containing protein [Larkinella rosea]RRB04419.1 serine/threonine-protein phosphatase [Larkinella rosea]